LTILFSQILMIKKKIIHNLINTILEMIIEILKIKITKIYTTLQAWINYWAHQNKRLKCKYYYIYMYILSHNIVKIIIRIMSLRLKYIPKNSVKMTKKR
jgi:hypothetical protein